MAMDIMLDPGHGGLDPGAVGPAGLREKDCTLGIAQRVGTLLARGGLTVGFTRTADETVPLSERAAAANKAGASRFVSVHINSATTAAATGTETYALAAGGEGEKLARSIQVELAGAVGLPDRGVKYANYAVLRESTMPAALTEVCFLSNPAEEALLRQDGFLDRAAEGIALGILSYFGRKPAPPAEPSGTPLLAAARAQADQAQAWAAAKGAARAFIDNAALYWEQAPKRGLDPVAAYCQYALETGYGHFGGTVDESFYNPCGLKTAQGGGDADPAAHMRFSSWAEGISAHLDHLALYAGAPGYPRAAKATADPRHFAYLLGTCTTVEALGGKWAPAADYGKRTVTLMNELIATPASAAQSPVGNTPPDTASDWARDAWEKAWRLGILDGTKPQDALTREQAAAVLDRLGLLEGSSHE